MPEESNSVLKPLKDLQGKTFHVGNYQRGYRWTEEQVTKLLEDFTAFAQQEGDAEEIYFLQSIVVSCLDETKEVWELIDGQQRLTTIYLMDAVLRKLRGKDESALFNIEYETRPGSAEFLKNLADNPDDAEQQKNKNIDFYHMFQACITIHDYFKDKQCIQQLYSIFTENIHILWYDTTGEEGTSADRFTRLNRGRIPLTGAELSRALLLNPANHHLSGEFEKDPQLKQQIVTQRQIVLGSRWDDIERELHDPDFWAFLGNKISDPRNKISDPRATRMDFLLDVYTDKPAEDTKELFAFDELSRKLEEKGEDGQTRGDAQTLWDDITRSYQMLRFWYEDYNYYHWIGYLSDQSGQKEGEEIKNLLSKAKGSLKSEFKDFVFSKIREPFSELSKETPLSMLEGLNYKGDYTLISKLLFLFNVEYARQNGRYGDTCGEGLFNREYARQKGRFAGRFPFGEHRAHTWSLEHIHPQNPGPLQTEKEWKDWVKAHRDALEEIQDESLPKVGFTSEQKEELVKKCEDFLDRLEKKQASRDEFQKLQGKVWSFLQKLGGASEDEHSLFNLALLEKSQNSALSNSFFAVKCRLVREMRKHREYVPIATEAIFMRRFSEEDLHLPYWSEKDREGYGKALLDVLRPFFGWKIKDEG